MTRIASSPADMRTMLKACVFALCCVPAPVIAAKGLVQEETLNEGLIAISMANVTDVDLAERAGWHSIKSALTYRKPGKYLRQIQLLSPQQRSQATLAPAQIVHLVKNALRA